MVSTQTAQPDQPSQVDEAIKYLEKSFELDSRDNAVYTVKVKRTDGSAYQRGILLREPLEACQPVSFTVDMKPVIHEVREPNVQGHERSHKDVSCQSCTRSDPTEKNPEWALLWPTMPTPFPFLLQVEVEGDSSSAEPSGKEDEAVSSSQADRVR